MLKNWSGTFLGTDAYTECDKALRLKYPGLCHARLIMIMMKVTGKGRAEGLTK